MIPRSVIPEALLRKAESQAWMLAREQVLSAGVGDRVIARHRRQGWFAIAPGVYSLRPEPTWLGLCWAGLLLGGPGATLGLAAAGHLHGLMPAPDELAIWVPRHRQVAGRSPWFFHRGNRAGLGHPPRTGVVQTVLDLAARQPPDVMVGMLAEAIGRRRTTPEAILAGLAATARHPNRRLLTEILADVAEGARSPLELRYLRLVERAHSLPRADRQQNPADRNQVDAWYRRFRLVVELDGRAYHERSDRFRDLDRDNLHTQAGLATLRYGWHDTVGRPCQIARQVASVLSLRGWTGTPKNCPSCRNRPWV